MIGSTTRRFTKRSQTVTVVTLSTLREQLESLNRQQEGKLLIEKVSRDRVTIRWEAAASGVRVQSWVVLPSYPTGHEDDSPTNPNVVLDPLEFVGADTHEERERFVPLLGHDVLVHYEKMHPQPGLKMTRCC